MSFQQLALVEPILKALRQEGYEQPTPIQFQSIPKVLEGRDLLGCAQTGTGKTAAFAIPVIQLLHNNPAPAQDKRKIRALVLTPTRELAIQIQESFQAYGKYTNLRNCVIFGGVSQHGQTQTLQRGVDILVATPGRLLDLVQQKLVSLRDIEILVLDEADRMLDMGFIHDVRKVLTLVPQKRQTLFFSATMAPEIRKLADAILKNPAYVEVTPVSSTADTVTQSIYFVEKPQKLSLLIHLLAPAHITTALVFTRTKHGADKVARALNHAGITAEAIHGNKSQNARQRALTNFKQHTTRVLVATDIAARGIDIDELSFVFNFELPNVPETYVHRIGRTGRAGASGTAYSFCDMEERAYLRDIQKMLKSSLPVVDNHPYAGAPSGERRVQLQPASNRPANREQQRPNHQSGRGNNGAAKKHRSFGNNRNGTKPRFSNSNSMA